MTTNKTPKPTLNRLKSDATERSDGSDGALDVEIYLVKDSAVDFVVNVDIENGTTKTVEKTDELGQVMCGKQLSRRKLTLSVAVLFSVILMVVVLSVSLRKDNRRTHTVSSAQVANNPQVAEMFEDGQGTTAMEQISTPQSPSPSSTSIPSTSASSPATSSDQETEPPTSTLLHLSDTSKHSLVLDETSDENENTSVVSGELSPDNEDSMHLQSFPVSGNHDNSGSVSMNDISDSLDISFNDWKMMMMHAHNNRRQVFFEIHGVSHVPLKWSEGIAARAQIYAERLIGLDGCTILHGVDGDRYGGENLGYAIDYNQDNPTAVSPDSLLTAWFDEEKDRDDLFSKLHFSQVAWRSTEYFGCGGAKKSLGNGGTCFIQVCRYIRPGNCNVDWQAKESESLLPKMLETGSQCGDFCPPEGCD